MSCRFFSSLAGIILITTCGINFAYASVSIPMVLFNANGEPQNIGTITAEDSACGVLLTPNLHSLPAGVHGFHVHVNHTCAQNGMAAGGHLDPDKTDQHDGPYSHQGHQGDLPVLIVNQDGTATLPTLAAKFKLAQLSGHAFMIHAGGDNYSDHPEN